MKKQKFKLCFIIILHYLLCSYLVLGEGNDQNTSWESLGPEGGRISELFQHTTNSNILYAVHEALNVRLCKIYKSIDKGNTWTELSQIYGYVQCVTIDPTVPSTMYAFDGPRIYKSTDGGSSWSAMNDGLFNEDVNCMDFDATNGVLYVGTNGGGVFGSSVGTGIEDETISNELPRVRTLYQNYPNPFNMSTEIRYELNRSGRVNLSVFDINGRLIRKLVENHQESGIRSVVWDGKDFEGRVVSSGLYICKLHTADHMEMKKMVLQK